MKEKIVPDTSVLISGILTDLIEKGEIGEAEIIIPEFAVEELRAQASKGREIGFKGLEQIKKLRTLYKNITLTKYGRRQTMEEIQLARSGRIDALIIDVARENDAAIYTCDYVQYMFAEAEGIRTRYFEPYEKKKETRLSKMMTLDTMSVHLKEGTVPLAKRGKPGRFDLVKISDEILTADYLESIIKEIMDSTRYEEDSFVEISGHTATVVQQGDMRIAIARPPFADGIEITAVRPIAKLTLDEYKLSEKLKDRLSKKAEGVLISGPPGSGKSTFAASVAEFFEQKGKIVKTMESPRDLQVGPGITQYTKLKGSFENTADMLLLVRPDYTIYDEVRKTEDFEIFSDMRLAGIGMLGVVHATQPIDSIQRFISRVELGMVPHIIDTIIYIKEGRVDKVYYLTLVVRTPTGMSEADLARPLVEVRDFENDNMEYEIYTYGEQTVVVPVKANKENALERLAKKQVLSEIRRFDKSASVDFVNPNKIVIRVENDVIPKIIGKGGETIKELEERLGIGIDVSPKVETLGREVEFSEEEKGAYIIFNIQAKPESIANFYVEDEYLFSATIGKTGQIRVAKDSDVGRKVLRGIIKNRIKVFV